MVPCAGLIYWLDIVMGFMTGFVVIYNLRRRVIRDPRLVAEYYIWHAPSQLQIFTVALQPGPAAFTAGSAAHCRMQESLRNMNHHGVVA